MIIQDSIINISFPRVENLKKIYFTNDEILKKEFDEPTVLPVPDDAPSEIPRIVSSSSGGHSKLNISSEMMSMQTCYTGAYTDNWSLCRSYLINKTNNLFEFAQKLTDDKFSYIGLMTNLILNNVNNGTKTIAEKLSNLKTDANIYDINFRYTFVDKKDYFINIGIQNARIFSENSNPRIAGSLCDSSLQANTIGITIDVNDRIQFNNKNDYISSKKNFADIMRITTDVIDNKLEKLIELGEY